MQPIVLVVALAVPLPAASADAGDPPIIAVLPTAKAAGASAAVTRAADAALAKVDIGRTLSGRALRKKLRKNPATLVKKCRGEASCLARVGARAGATSVLIARTSFADAGQTRIVVERVDVATAAVVGSVELTVRKIAEVESGLHAKVAALWPAGTTETAVADAAKTGLAKPPADDPISTGVVSGSAAMGDAQGAGTQTTASSGGDAASGDATAAAAGDSGATDTTPVVANVATSRPAQKPASYRPGVLLWAGAGGAVVGATLTGLGLYFGNRARSLRELDPDSSQLDAIEQQDDQNRNASRANWLVPIGSVVLVGGLAAAAIDFLTGSPGLLTVDVHRDGASVGMAFSW